MTYTCACYPTADATLEQAQAHKYDLVARKLGLQPGMRLLDVGCGWGGMVRHAAEHYGVQALGVTLSREQALWAQERIKAEGLDHLAEVRHLDYRDVRERELRRGQLHRADRAHRRQELPGVLPVPAGPAAPRRPAAQPRHHPAGQPAPGAAAARLHRPLRVPRRRAHRVRRHRDRDGGLRPRGAAPGEPAGALRQHPDGVVREPGRALGRVRRRGGARRSPRSGASTWPAPGWRSSATGSSCTRCSPPAPRPTARPATRSATTSASSERRLPAGGSRGAAGTRRRPRMAGEWVPRQVQTPREVPTRLLSRSTAAPGTAVNGGSAVRRGGRGPAGG